MKNKLLIIGASGHGKVVADIAKKMNEWKSISFLDDNKRIDVSMGLQIIGTSDDVLKYIDDFDIFVGVGNNSIREKLQESLEAIGATIPKLIHPSAIIGNNVEIKPGTVVMPGAVVNCSTLIGKGCIINSGATIDHDNLIEDYVHISPGAHLAGTVKIGNGTWLGIGSIVSNNVSITKNCKIGAGAVVINDIEKGGTYMGVPAKIFKD
ncbi:acetyltransferase [Neobacillus sp. PS2-9]|uniref:acetyltransferase n=1 Tax=Neobacillus sp. PS2-9 TaxID=3070676 RepID=UPI0027E1BF59|nr:acetyltransferase [Neobacillus sp. PS2-9]WML58621.1 acetyltransferase [Neobacillus sp. PS2-9]